MGKTVMTIKMKSVDEIRKGIRHEWSFTPASRAFKSIRDYRRADRRAVERAARKGWED